MNDDEIMIAFMQHMLEKKGWVQSIVEFSKGKSDDELRWNVLWERLIAEQLSIAEDNNSFRLNDNFFL